MSEKQFSVDDILNEYSKKREDMHSNKQGFDVDEFLRDTKPKHSSDNILNTDKHMNINGSSSNFIPPKNFSGEYSSSLRQKPTTKEVVASVATMEKTNEIKTKEPESKPLAKQAIPLEATAPEVKKPEVNTPETSATQVKKESAASERRRFAKQLEKDNDYTNRKANGFGNTEFIGKGVKEIKPIRKVSGNTEIINNLLKLKKERVINKTAELTPVTRTNINDITLDIKSKIIPKTEQISMPEDLSETDRELYLQQQRNKKIKDFVLQDIDNELPEDEQVEDEDFDDYRTIEDAPAVHKSIVSLKSTLKGRLWLISILFVISTFLVVSNAYNIPVIPLLNRKTNPVTYLFVLTILGLFAAISSYSVIVNGIKNLFTLKADSDSLCSLALLTSLISSATLISNHTLFKKDILHIYIPVALGALMFNTIGKLLIVKRTEKNFDFVSSGGEKYSVFPVEDENAAENFTKGALNDIPNLVSIKKTEFVTDFLKNSYSEDISDRFCKIVVPIVFLVSLIVAALSVVFTNETSGSGLAVIAIANLAGTISLCSAFAIPLTVNIPLARASKRYLESSAAMIGYSAVEEYKDTNSIIVNATSLFPEGAVDFVNLKQLSATTIEEGILVAASLASHADSLLKAPFYKMLKGKTEMLYPVDSYVYEDSLGISGWIENKRVLLGNRELMENHSIEGLPSKEKEKKYAKNNGSIVYLSISGEVTTLFIVKTRASLGVSKWLAELERKHITVILHCVDSFISLNNLSELFDVSPDTFKLLPFRFHQQFAEQTSYVPKIDSPLLCSGRFQTLAMVVSGAKRIYNSSVFGLSLMLISIVVASILCIMLAVLKSFNQLNCVNVLLYNLIFTAITVFLQANKKV